MAGHTHIWKKWRRYRQIRDRDQGGPQTFFFLHFAFTARDQTHKTDEMHVKNKGLARQRVIRLLLLSFRHLMMRAHHWLLFLLLKMLYFVSSCSSSSSIVVVCSMCVFWRGTRNMDHRHVFPSSRRAGTLYHNYHTGGTATAVVADAVNFCET